MADSTDIAFDPAQLDTINPVGVQGHHCNHRRIAVVDPRLRGFGADGPSFKIGCGKSVLVRPMLKEGSDMTGVELPADDPSRKRLHICTPVLLPIPSSWKGTSLTATVIVNSQHGQER